jgi:hypothetical protein
MNPNNPALHPVDDELLRRLIRIETRLIRLMRHLGLDADGNTPQQRRQLIEQQGDH